MYEGDTPNAERRAAALSLDRDLLRELLGQEELRDLIDPAALEEVEADLQRRSERTRAANSDALHDVLRAVGDLTVAEAQARCLGAVSAERMLARPGGASGGRWRCASAARSAASPPRTPGCTATPSAPCRPAGLPGRLPRGGRGPLRAPRAPLRPHPRPLHHPRAGRALRGGPRPGAARARARGRRWCAASCGPGAPSASGATPMCCAACAAPRWPRCARRSSPPSSRRWPASCPPGRASTQRRPGGAGVDRLREHAGAAAGRGRSRPRCGSATCCPGASAPTRPPGSTSSAPAASWCGWAPGRWAGRSGKVALYFREDARWLGPPPNKADRPEGAAARAHPRAAGARAPRSGPTCSPIWPTPSPPSCRRRCGTSSGPAR